MKTDNIKAIIFDFMGVLLFQKSDYSPDPLVDEIDDAIGKVTDDSVFEKQTCEKFHLSKDQFNNILDKVVWKYESYKPLWELLPLLRKTYKLAILNNGTGLTLPKLKAKFDVETKFDLFVSSAKEGIKKPSPEIYLLTARKLGVCPEECLFMDDSYENVEGAKSAGMKTLWWEREKNREEIFKEFVGLCTGGRLPPMSQSVSRLKRINISHKLNIVKCQSEYSRFRINWQL